MSKKVSTSTVAKFDNKCSLRIHVSGDDQGVLYELEQKRFVNSEEKQYILKNCLIKDDVAARKNRKIYVCDKCLKIVQSLIMNPTKRVKYDVKSKPAVADGKKLGEGLADGTVSAVINALNDGQISDTQLSNLIEAVGRRIRMSFERKQDTSKSSNQTRLDEMKTTSYLDLWNVEGNDEWKQLLQAVCHLQKPVDASSARLLVKCTDLVRANIDHRYISNVALSEALLLLQFCHSKYAVDVFCRTNAAGSFSTVRRTMSLLGSKEFQLPENDVVLVFDNNQVIQRTWMFKFGGKQVVSAVTTMACYNRTEPRTSFQFTSSIPTALFPTDANKGTLVKLYNDFTSQSGALHRGFRKTFIEDRIRKVAAECTLVGGSVQDVVSRDTVIIKPDDMVFGYSRVHSVTRNCQVQDAECLAQNPNSFKAVGIVLDRILQYLNESTKERNFIPVYMDGAPFSICMKLIRDKYVCGTCCVDIDSTSKIKHIESNHKNEKEPTWSRKYKKIVIRPGSGHIEMACVRAIISTFWIPFIKPFAAILGYNSESQLDYCKKAYDHHKSYNLLMVVFSALTDELLYAYVKHALLAGVQPSYDNFLQWAENFEKGNLLYGLASTFCFTTLHSLHLFRSGIRNCNDEITLKARHKLTSLLYGCNNIKYQEILCYDTCFLLSIDPGMRRLVMEESSRRENGEAGEGYDFLLENRNKLYKSFLPSDSAPSFEQWLNVTKRAVELEEIRDIAGERIDLNIRPPVQRVRKFNDEIHGVRKLIRSHGLLLKENQALCAIDNTSIKLDSSFLNYVRQCETNRQQYYEHYLKNEKVHLPLINAGMEFNPLTNKDDELKEAVTRKLNMLREPFFTFYKKSFKKNMSKQELYDYYKALEAQLENQEQVDIETALSESFQCYLDLQTE